MNEPSTQAFPRNDLPTFVIAFTGLDSPWGVAHLQAPFLLMQPRKNTDQRGVWSPMLFPPDFCESGNDLGLQTLLLVMWHVWEKRFVNEATKFSTRVIDTLWQPPRFLVLDQHRGGDEGGDFLAILDGLHHLLWRVNPEDGSLSQIQGVRLSALVPPSPDLDLSKSEAEKFWGTWLRGGDP